MHKRALLVAGGGSEWGRNRTRTVKEERHLSLKDRHELTNNECALHKTGKPDGGPLGPRLLTRY